MMYRKKIDSERALRRSAAFEDSKSAGSSRTDRVETVHIGDAKSVSVARLWRDATKVFLNVRCKLLVRRCVFIAWSFSRFAVSSRRDPILEAITRSRFIVERPSRRSAAKKVLRISGRGSVTLRKASDIPRHLVRSETERYLRTVISSMRNVIPGDQPSARQKRADRPSGKSKIAFHESSQDPAIEREEGQFCKRASQTDGPVASMFQYSGSIELVPAARRTIYLARCDSRVLSSSSSSSSETRFAPADQRHYLSARPVRSRRPPRDRERIFVHLAREENRELSEPPRDSPRIETGRGNTVLFYV